MSVRCLLQQVASLIGANPKEVIFTSGATESNNISVKGVARCGLSRPTHSPSISKISAAIFYFTLARSFPLRIAMNMVIPQGPKQLVNHDYDGNHPLYIAPVCSDPLCIQVLPGAQEARDHHAD